MKRRSSAYLRGFLDGIPIGLGYLSVSFGFGILAVSQGLPFSVALLISMTNLTSAGQVAGVSVMASGGGAVEMILTQLVINLRYALMSLTLSQKLSPKYNLAHRLLTSFGITDEVFAIASSSRKDLEPSYMYGLITLPFLGWTGGTAMGALLGNFLPASLQSALGIAIYGMFLAIVTPPAKKNKGILLASLLAAGISAVIVYVPIFSFITSGFSVIVCALVSAGVVAIFFPIPGEENGKEGAV